MSEYQHILVALDYCEHNQLVAEKAITLAEQHRASLSAVHVLDNIAMPDTGYGAVISLSNHGEYPELEAEKVKFNQLIEALNINSQHAWMIWGNPRQEIVELSDKLGVDLIVMGSHGRHGLSHLLGSTAHAVLHHARCDVLAVKIKDVR